MPKTLPILATVIVVFGPSVSPCQEPLVPSSAMEQLQSITDRIRACKEEDITPVDPNSKERLPFLLLQGPALNVTWDIKKSESVIKPFQGIIEFVTYSRVWAPDSALEKSKQLSKLVAQLNASPEPLKHRYVFELVHGEFVLSTMTESGSNSKEKAEPKTYRCWQTAAGVKKPEPDKVQTNDH